MRGQQRLLKWAAVLAAALVLGTFLFDIWLDIDYRLDANVALGVMAVVENLFTGLYFVRSNWRRNRIGQIFMAKSVALSAVLIQAGVSSWWPGTDYPFRHQIRFVIYTVGAFAYVLMTIALWLEQRNDRRASAGEDGEVTERPWPL